MTVSDRETATRAKLEKCKTIDRKLEKEKMCVVYFSFIHSQ